MKIFENVIARNEAISILYRSGGDNLFDDVTGSGVILSPSKYGGRELFPRTLRQAQFDNAILVLFIFLACSFQSINAFAQSNTAGKDAPKKKFLIILDNAIYKGELTSIASNKIFYTKVLKPNEATSKYGDKGKDGAVIVFTNEQIVIKSYQTKFSKFSNKYRDYVLNNQNKDEGLEYVLDGKDLDDDYERVTKLFELSAEKINTVDLVKNPEHNGYQGKKGIVVINTKQ